MKNFKKILFSLLVLFSLQFGLGGCVVDGGGYYHDEGPWYHDGPWLYGDGWGGDRRGGGHIDIDIHPPGFRRH